jgi:hypothetical protein
MTPQAYAPLIIAALFFGLLLYACVRLSEARDRIDAERRAHAKTIDDLKSQERATDHWRGVAGQQQSRLLADRDTIDSLENELAKRCASKISTDSHGSWLPERSGGED